MSKLLYPAYLFFLIIPLLTFGQNGIIKGVITDRVTGEPLIGANVVYAPGKGVVSDFDGKYVLNLADGTYTINVSYVGFQSETKEIVVKSNTILSNFKLSTVTLTEVEIVGDIAKTRETPVAFMNISPAKLEEELASQDIPMILNKTPGVYATQQGGGDGDARINIRGFNQRNIAVMIDGIPVNDMENGWVYWSNWFGLDAVTRNIQVQRGLGASKLGIPSVGGTMNIITKGIQNKREISLSQEIGNDNFTRTSLGLTTGKMANGFSITAAGSFKKGDGWVDQAWTEGWFYFLKVDKEIGKHIISFSAMGAPQQHGQRPYKKSIATFSKDVAAELEIDTTGTIERGLRFNQHWGYLERFDLDPNGDTIKPGRKLINERINYYHKPQFSLRDFWNINRKLYVSNIVYLSIGNGGGTALKNTPTLADYDANGQINLQKYYNSNRFSPFSIDMLYSDNEHKSSQYIRSSVNNHFWYGTLSTFNYLISNSFELSGGVDLRSYKGEHYQEVYDLLGGDYAIDQNNKNQSSPVKRVGDKVNYHNDGIVKWGGLFSQLQYKRGNLTTFANLTGAYTGYKRIDYFKKKVIKVGDTTLQVGYIDTVTYMGVKYTRDSEGVNYLESDWKWIPGFTFKLGANYNISERSNVFANVGLLSKSPRFNNVYDNNNVLFRDIKNEIVKAAEIGYSYYSPIIAINVNAYVTGWNDKPADRGVAIIIDDVSYSANINGMDALHKGMEVDMSVKLFDKLNWEQFISLGDWRWTSEDTVLIYDDNKNLVSKRYFNAKGVHVGDAAQLQWGQSLRYQIIKGLYAKGTFTYFDNYYAEFDPLTLDGSPKSLDENGNPRDSWKLPFYYLVDFHAGYTIRFSKYKIDLRASILNLLDKKYIADANNNDSYSTTTADFDAKSAGVFFGSGRRFNTSIKFTL